MALKPFSSFYFLAKYLWLLGKGDENGDEAREVGSVPPLESGNGAGQGKAGAGWGLERRQADASCQPLFGFACSVLS